MSTPPQRPTFTRTATSGRPQPPPPPRVIRGDLPAGVTHVWSPDHDVIVIARHCDRVPLQSPRA